MDEASAATTAIRTLSAVTERVVVGAAIVRDGLLLAAQRSYPAELDGRWELPGGQVELGESDVAALARECHEELAVDVVIGRQVGGDVPLPGGKVLRIFAAELADFAREPVAVTHRALRWVADDGLESVDWLPADEVLLPDLRALLRAGLGVTGLHRPRG